MTNIKLFKNIKKMGFFGLHLEAEDLFGLLKYDEEVYLPVILKEPGSLHIGFYPQSKEAQSMDWVKFPIKIPVNKMDEGWPNPVLIARTTFKNNINEEKLKALLNDYEE